MSTLFWQRCLRYSRLLFPLTFILTFILQLWVRQGTGIAAILAGTSVASAMLWQYCERRQRRPRRPNVSYAPMQFDDESHT